TLEMLEKKEKVLLKKAAGEVEKAKEFTRAKNKRAAIQCLKRKRLYEQQIEQLEISNYVSRPDDNVRRCKSYNETVDALRTGASAMKAMQKATNIDDVDKTMDEINEQTENMKQIQEALATPIGSAADFDEDELEAELEEWKVLSWRNNFFNPPQVPLQHQCKCQVEGYQLVLLLKSSVQPRKRACSITGRNGTLSRLFVVPLTCNLIDHGAKCWHPSFISRWYSLD
ncbi:hypothetical protein C3L33_19365, partial [Rhododendron williamsianum]